MSYPKHSAHPTRSSPMRGLSAPPTSRAAKTPRLLHIIARRRDQHYQPWYERLVEPPALSADADAVERMAHRLKTAEGRALYGLRKQTAEPVFGIINQAMRFRQFLLRGIEKVPRRVAAGGACLQPQAHGEPSRRELSLALPSMPNLLSIALTPSPEGVSPTGG